MASMSLDDGTSCSYPSPYAHCSKKECMERQELKQVSVFETTAETGHLPQHRRQMDPRLAITKFRRSVAGTNNNEQRRKQQQRIGPTGDTLESIMTRLIYILAHQRASPDHPVQTLWTTAEFVTDRLRACQVEATAEINEQHVAVPVVKPHWHLLLVRCLLLLRYLSQGMAQDRYALIEKSSVTLIWTAFHEYWVAVDSVGHDTRTAQAMKEIDELLYLTTLCHLSNWLLAPQENPLSWILSHAYKHVEIQPVKAARGSVAFQSYPLFQSSLSFVAMAARQEYGHLLLVIRRDSPVLGRCCVAGALGSLRYQSLSQYNSSFAKKEVVRDMDRLLGYEGQSGLYLLLRDCQSFGLPVTMVEEKVQNKSEEAGDEGRTTAVNVVMKQAAISNENLPLPARRDDDHWVLGLAEEHVSLSRLDADGLSIPSSVWMKRVLLLGCYSTDSSTI
jgi:hypothetical protein